MGEEERRIRSEALRDEHEWLMEAHRNSVDKGFSADLREGFRLAAGWVAFHAGHPELARGRVETIGPPDHAP